MNIMYIQNFFLKMFNLNLLHRSIDNYLVKNHNRQFEVNICGRLTDKNKCGGNITTICDITDQNNSKVYAVGYYGNDKLEFDAKYKSLKLIQYQNVTKNKRGRRIEFIFKCNESILPKDTKITFLFDEKNNKNNNNVARFEVVTSVVCLPRMSTCEFFNKEVNFNLKHLHKRVGNWMVLNERAGGHFYLNVCSYLNQFGEKIPNLCTADGSTSACYVDSSGKAISIGSTQIGPYYEENSLLLKYLDGNSCKNSLKWSTIINFTCSDESQLIHEVTNLTLCTHEFLWKSPKACPILFNRKDQCMVTHPQNSKIIYDMNNLKNQNFEINDFVFGYNAKFSVCNALQTPCNGNLDSAACWSVNGIEINIGVVTEQIVFDNGKIYLTMQGEKCNRNGPNSFTVIRFVCDYSDSNFIDHKKNLEECTFEFFVYTKYACTPSLKVNCTIIDELGNTYNLSSLSKLNRNYVITINHTKKVVLNVCHSVINNDIDGINCQINSGVCLIDKNQIPTSKWLKNLGFVYESPYKKENKFFLEMNDGFLNGNSVSSIIEFVCSNKTIDPIFVKEENCTYFFEWSTSLVCSPGTRINIHNSTTTLKTVNIAKHKLFTESESYTLSKNYVSVETDSKEEFIFSTIEKYEESDFSDEDENTILKNISGKTIAYDGISNMSNIEEKDSSSLFNTIGAIIVIILISVSWCFRLKLQKQIQKSLNSWSLLRRRRRRSFDRYY